MVKIKLTRIGRKGKPFYRIIVQEARSKRDGRFIDSLGFYDPLKDPPQVKIDKEKYLHWLQQGAKPTETVANLIKMKKLLP